MTVSRFFSIMLRQRLLLSSQVTLYQTRGLFRCSKCARNALVKTSRKRPSQAFCHVRGKGGSVSYCQCACISSVVQSSNLGDSSALSEASEWLPQLTLIKRFIQGRLATDVDDRYLVTIRVFLCLYACSVHFAVLSNFESVSFCKSVLI